MNLEYLAHLLKQQEELIKEKTLLFRGAEVSMFGQSDDDLFQKLLESYPKSVRRFEILYKRFSLLHALQKKRLVALRKAHENTFEEEKKRILRQNKIFNRFYKKSRQNPAPTILEQGNCLGVTLDLIAKKIAGQPKPVIKPTTRGRRLQQKYIDYRLASIETLQRFYMELTLIHFDTPVHYFTVYKMLCQKWTKVFEEIGGKKVKNEFLKAEKIFEKKKLRGHRENLPLYRKFFRKVNEYALLVIDEIPESLSKELGFKIIPTFSNKHTSAETFIRNIEKLAKKYRKHPYVIIAFKNDIEKTHHMIYCSLSRPYELQDSNFPEFNGFRTNSFSEFQLFLCFWSCFYDFASFKELYKILPYQL